MGYRIPGDYTGKYSQSRSDYRAFHSDTGNQRFRHNTDTGAPARLPVRPIPIFSMCTGLDAKLGIPAGSKWKTVMDAMKGHMVQYGGQAIATYSR